MYTCTTHTIFTTTTIIIIIITIITTTTTIITIIIIITITTAHLAALVEDAHQLDDVPMVQRGQNRHLLHNNAPTMIGSLMLVLMLMLIMILMLEH
jgi:hypothetical protein